jgi:hypothetical protein
MVVPPSRARRSRRNHRQGRVASDPLRSLRRSPGASCPPRRDRWSGWSRRGTGSPHARPQADFLLRAVRRERNLATDRVIGAIRAGGIEPRTMVSIIDRSASPMSQEAAPVIGVAPIPFNDPDGGDDLIAKWAKWPGQKGKPPGAKTVYEARRMMRKTFGVRRF